MMNFDAPLLVDVDVIFVRASFFDLLVTRTALASDVEERCLLPHVTGEARKHRFAEAVE